MTIEEFGADILAALQSIASSLIRNASPPVRFSLGLPVLTKKDGTQMNFQLPNDIQFADVMITTTNAAGAIVPAPAGDIDSVVSSDITKAIATVGTMPSGPNKGAPSIHLVPVAGATAVGVTATLTDTSGLTPFVMPFDVVADITPKALGADIADAILTP